jgi:antitoxin CcdA
MTEPAAAFSRRRPVNLSLSENLVREVRELTPNLSGTVESLLAEFVERERQRRREQWQQGIATCRLWNEFDANHGAFADEYSTL